MVNAWRDKKKKKEEEATVKQTSKKVQTHRKMSGRLWAVGFGAMAAGRHRITALFSLLVLALFTVRSSSKPLEEYPDKNSYQPPRPPVVLSKCRSLFWLSFLRLFSDCSVAKWLRNFCFRFSVYQAKLHSKASLLERILNCYGHLTPIQLIC